MKIIEVLLNYRLSSKCTLCNLIDTLHLIKHTAKEQIKKTRLEVSMATNVQSGGLGLCSQYTFFSSLLLADTVQI